MKKIFTLFLLFNFQFSKAQHYTQGVAFDTTLYSGAYVFSTGCSQTYMANISLDPSVYNYPSGLQFILIMDSVSHPYPPAQPFHAGDTFLLDSTHPFHLISPNMYFRFRIKLVGTPTMAGQIYPCNLVLEQCACFCFNMTIKAAPGSTNCSVDLFNSVAEADKPGLSIFPNPVANALLVNGISGKTGLRLYDSFGKLVMAQETDGNSILNTSHLPEGVYTLSIDNGKNKTFTKVLVAR